MKILLKLFVIICFFFLCQNSVFAQQQSVELNPLGEVSYLELAPDYSYYLFTGNNNFLLWFEGYTNVLFIYNLETNKLKKIKLVKGRGPHEVNTISSISLIKDTIYLVDHTNIKFIRITTSGKYLEDLVPSTGLRPISIVSNKSNKIIMDPYNQNALFYSWEMENYVPVKLKEKIVIEEFDTIFKKQGYVALKNDYLVHLTKYYPNLYVYDLGKRVLIKKIVFDESEVDGGGTRARSDGAKMMFPPEKVDILSEDVANIPGVPGRIFLLAKGASDNRDYDLDKLFEYDFEKEEFVATHDLGVKATEITVNDNYLFVYSKEENEIYQYEIVVSN
jgi:dipeptidyl aminopeptidase/acylaminoacyl peptidase